MELSLYSPYIPSCSGQTTTSSIFALFQEVKNLPYEGFTSWTCLVFSTVQLSDLILLKNFLMNVINLEPASSNVTPNASSCVSVTETSRTKIRYLVSKFYMLSEAKTSLKIIFTHCLFFQVNFLFPLLLSSDIRVRKILSVLKGTIYGRNKLKVKAGVTCGYNFCTKIV